MGISIWQILIIVLVILLLFGSRKIPGLMRDLGSGMTAFKSGLKSSNNEDGDNAQEVDEASPAVENQEASSTASSSRSKGRSGSRKRSTANS